MFKPTKRSKKTLTNELNVAGSSDNRRLDADVTPAINSVWATAPSSSNSLTLSLGTSQNRWRNYYTKLLYCYAPKIPMIWDPLDNADPSGTPATKEGCYWWLKDNGNTTLSLCKRYVYYWNGSAWTLETSPLYGQVFYCYTGNSTTDRKLLFYTGEPGDGKGWTKNGSVQFLIN